MFLIILKWLLYVLFGFSFTCIAILVCFGFVPSFRKYRLTQKLPGPKGYFLFGNAIELLSVPHDDLVIWISGYFKTYKRMFRMWYLGFSTVYMIDPNDIQVVLSSNDYISKGVEYDILKPWLGEGLLTSTGAKWHSRRKMLTPAFHFKILEENMSTFNTSSKVFCEKILNLEHKEVNMENYICDCTLDVITKSAMGVDLEEQKEEGSKYLSRIKLVSELVTYRVMSPWLIKDYIFNISPAGRTFNKGIAYLHQFSINVIKEKRSTVSTTEEVVSSSGKRRKAFLDLILEYEVQNKNLLTDKDIREEVDTFMFEGHDTTSSGINFTFFNLAKYQDIQENVYKELNAIFGDDERDITVHDLQQMVYLEKVIKESLRLYPSVPGITRLIEKDLVLSDGTLIPAWTNITIPIILLHKNEKYWKDPLLFDPERFSEENIKGRHPYSYIPFSAGPRNCIGQKFAMMELKTVIAHVVRKFKILPVTKEEEFKTVAFLILRTNKPIKCKFEPRI